MAEIRLDLTTLTLDEIARLFRSPLPLVAAFRPGRASPSERAAALETAIAAGAAFVDIEADASPAYVKRLGRAARDRGCRIILSAHSERRPPSAERLARAREGMFRRGADIVKIVHRAVSADDCLRILSLYQTRRGGRVIALGTGRAGVATRIAAPLLGAPFTYASLRPGRETAQGQLDWRTLDRVLKLVGHD
jgi:3-dehydroquinate dehydratase type I